MSQTIDFFHNLFSQLISANPNTLIIFLITAYIGVVKMHGFYNGKNGNAGTYGSGDLCEVQIIPHKGTGS
jgi:hypothetical protein